MITLNHLEDNFRYRMLFSTFQTFNNNLSNQQISLTNIISLIMCLTYVSKAFYNKIVQ